MSKGMDDLPDVSQSAAVPRGLDSAAGDAPAIPGYDIHVRLGEGGMGVVWAGTQLSTKRRVAIKLLNAAAFGSTQARSRFAREVELAASLQHPHIARVYDSGLEKGVWYYAMELVEGMPLDKYLQTAKLTAAQTVQLIQLVCQGMQHAHQRGVIHRDLKPSNILVSADGRPHILDFGLAKGLWHDAAEAVTMHGDISGTPAYMSPEQARGEAAGVDTRSDVYSLGVILYHGLTRQMPHDVTGTYVAVLRRIADEEIMPPRRALPGLDRDLEAMLLKALAKKPEERYGSAADLAGDLAKYLAGDPVSARPATMGYFLSKRLRKHRVGVSLAAAVAAIMLGTAAWSYWSISAARARADEQARNAIAANAAKQEAVKHALLTLADSFTMRGLENGGTNGVQALWLANAAMTAATPGAEDQERVESNLLRINAVPPSWEPVAVVDHAYVHIAFEPDDSRYLLSQRRLGEQSLPAAAAVWDLGTEKPLALPEGFAQPTAAVWLPGKRLLLGSAKGVLLAQMPELKNPRIWTTPAPVECVSASADGRFVAASAGGTLFVWPVDGDAPATTNLPAEIADVRFGAVQPLLAVVTYKENKARLYRVDLTATGAADLEPVIPAVPHVYTEDRWTRIPMLLDGDKVFVTINDVGTTDIAGHFNWYDTATGALAASTADDQMRNVRELEPAPDGKTFLSEMGSSAIYNVATRKRQARVGGITAAAFSPQGNLLAVDDTNGTIVLPFQNNDVARVTTLPRLPLGGHFAISPDNRFLAISNNSLVKVMRTPTQRPPVTTNYALRGHSSWVAFSSDSRYITPVGGLDREGEVTAIQVFDVTQRGPAIAPIALPGAIESAAFSPDGRRIAAMTGLRDEPRQLQIWDWATRTQVGPTFPLPAEPSWVAFSPDGKLLAAHCVDGSVDLIDPATTRPIKHIAAMPRDTATPWCTGPGTVRFSHDGKLLFTWGGTKAQVWDLASTDKPRFEVQHNHAVWAVDESPDGKLLATASYDYTVRLTELATGKESLPPIPHPGNVIGVRFSPDGKSIVTACQDQQVRVWDVATGALKVAISPGGTLASVMYTPDGRWIVSGEYNDYQVWDAVTGFAVSHKIEEPNRPYHLQLDISQDGRWVAHAGSGGTFSVTDLAALTHVSATPAASLLWAELVSYSRVNGAAIVSLSSSEWDQRWQAYRRDHPADPAVFIPLPPAASRPTKAPPAPPPE